MRSARRWFKVAGLLTISLAMVFTSLAQEGEGDTARGSVLLTYLGHQCFLIEGSDGTRVLCDPYTSPQPTGLHPLPDGLTADAVLITHDHLDHSNAGAIAGQPLILDAAGEWQIGSVTVRGYEGLHGGSAGRSGVVNVAFVIEVEGVRILHLGDSGVITDEETVAAIADCDVVIMNVHPMVIPWFKSMPFMDSIGARTMIPSHYSHFACCLWSTSQPAIDGFLAYPDPKNIVVGSDQVELYPEMPREFIIMTPSLLDESFLSEE